MKEPPSTRRGLLGLKPVTRYLRAVANNASRNRASIRLERFKFGLSVGNSPTASATPCMDGLIWAVRGSVQSTLRYLRFKFQRLGYSG